MHNYCGGTSIHTVAMQDGGSCSAKARLRVTRSTLFATAHHVTPTLLRLLGSSKAKSATLSCESALRRAKAPNTSLAIAATATT